MDNKPGVVKDFQRAAEESTWKPETLRKIATHRLATAVVEGRPSNVAREVELTGKMKQVDLFVRNTDEPQGIFVSFMQPPPEINTDYYDCAWCDEDFDSASELQAHSLVCPKRPITAQTTSPQLEAPGKGTA